MDLKKKKKKRVPKSDFLIKEQNESPRGKSKSDYLIKKQNSFLKKKLWI